MASSSKVNPGSTEGAEDPTSKQFQEKYYPISPSFINKYDPYTLQSTIDEELTKVSVCIQATPALEQTNVSLFLLRPI